VAALQVTPVHYLFRPDDPAMLGHFRAIGEAAGLPVIIYNVVPWSYLLPKLLCRIMAEVPG
jgi:4-hydroxy-tetrahydrodipicolinate synthase